MTNPCLKLETILVNSLYLQEKMTFFKDQEYRNFTQSIVSHFGGTSNFIEL